MGTMLKGRELVIRTWRRLLHNWKVNDSKSSDSRDGELTILHRLCTMSRCGCQELLNDEILINGVLEINGVHGINGVRGINDVRGISGVLGISGILGINGVLGLLGRWAKTGRDGTAHTRRTNPIGQQIFSFEHTFGVRGKCVEGDLTGMAHIGYTHFIDHQMILI